MRTSAATRISVATLVAIIGLIAVIGGTRPQGVSAAPFTVTKTADTNDGACNADCSLREAVVAANALAGHDNISIPAGIYMLTGAAGENASATGDLDVTDSVSFNGSGMTTTQINGGGIENVIEVFDSATTLILTDLSVGNASGDAVHATAANIDLANVVAGENTDDGVETASGNVTLASSWVAGNLDNGIFTTAGNVTITRSTVSNNGNSGVQTQTGNITTTNSTVSTNDDGVSTQDGDITLNWSTVASNGGAGAEITESGLIYMYGALAANNVEGDCSQVTEDSASSMDTDGTCGLGGGEVSDGTANLGPLQNNGGITLTHALLTGSDAIDAGGESCPEDDQRGEERFQGAGCDIGAYEGVSTAPTSTPVPAATATPCNGPCPTATPTTERAKTHTPTVTLTAGPTNTAAASTGTPPATPPTGGGAEGGVITPPDTGSGPGGDGVSGLITGAALLAIAGAIGMGAGRRLRD